MSAINPSKNIETELVHILDALLALSHEENGERGIVYRPRFRQFTGSTNGAILLQQIWFWFCRSKYDPFYKFLEPCTNELYREGDSWTEELGWSADEFRTAISKIGKKVTTGESKAQIYDESIVIYWRDNNGVTWFDMNLINFAKAIEVAYADISLPLGKQGLSVYLAKLGKKTCWENGDGQLTSNTYMNYIEENTSEQIPVGIFSDDKDDEKVASKKKTLSPQQQAALEAYYDESESESDTKHAMIVSLERFSSTKLSLKHVAKLSTPAQWVDPTGQTVRLYSSWLEMWDKKDVWRDYLIEVSWPRACGNQGKAPAGKLLNYAIGDLKYFMDWCARNSIDNSDSTAPARTFVGKSPGQDTTYSDLEEIDRHE